MGEVLAHAADVPDQGAVHSRAADEPSRAGPGRWNGLARGAGADARASGPSPCPAAAAAA